MQTLGQDHNDRTRCLTHSPLSMLVEKYPRTTRAIPCPENQKVVSSHPGPRARFLFSLLTFNDLSGKSEGCCAPRQMEIPQWGDGHHSQPGSLLRHAPGSVR